MSSEYVGFVYQWTNQKNQKKYIGSHCGKDDDGYIGSGKYFLRAFNKNTDRFVRTILEYVQGGVKELKAREQHYLDSVDNIVNNKQYYNVSPNATGGYNHGHLSKEAQNTLYQKWQDASRKRLATMTPDEKENLANQKRETWQRNTARSYKVATT